jgi:hypothetical protein
MSTPFPFSFPIVMTAAGLQPQAPATLLTQLLAAVASTNPGYTANLPGGLIEDISSTDVGSVAIIDQAKVELVNSLTPNGANLFLLGQLGQIYLGQTQPGQATNTSVPVVFAGQVGYVIPQGLVIGDGTNAYQVQVGGVIGGGGTSATINAIAVNPGSFGVPANTVNVVITTVPTSVGLTVNNPLAGNPGGAPETPFAFRARVLQAGLAASVGTQRYIKTLIGLVLGSQANLISVQQTGSGLKVVVGGSADQFSIANAIYMSVADVTTLQPKSAGGSNVTVSLVDSPDIVTVQYVAAAQQTVTMSIVWNTVLTSFTGGAAFPGLVQPPLVAYINSLGVGQVINVLEMNEIFQTAVQSVLDVSLLTRLVFTVDINGTPTAPNSGTYAIQGDSESYFFTALNGSGISVTQG